MKKLLSLKQRERGFSHIEAAMAIVVIVAIVFVGGHSLLASHADSLTYSAFQNASDAAVSTGVSTETVPINFLGSQVVSVLQPGAQLMYQDGVKGPISSTCYYVQTQQIKGETTTVAKIQLVGYLNYETITYNNPDPNMAQFVRYCVNAGTKTSTPLYNVYNESPANGPAVLVYQEIANF